MPVLQHVVEGYGSQVGSKPHEETLRLQETAQGRAVAEVRPAQVVILDEPFGITTQRRHRMGRMEAAPYPWAGSECLRDSPHSRWRGAKIEHRSRLHGLIHRTIEGE